MKKVTVLMNSYRNDPDHLREAISSYSLQSVDDIEVEIIVSTVEDDPAVKIAKKMGCIVVTGKKPNIFEQINRAAKKATGDFICYASGNDVALPGKLKTETELLQKNNKLVCYSAFFVTNEKLEQKKLRSFFPYDHKLHRSGKNFVSDCSMMTRQVLDKYLPFNVRFKNHAYFDFWLRVAEGEGKNMFIYNPEPAWMYRVSENSRHVQRKSDPKKVAENEKNRAAMLATHK